MQEARVDSADYNYHLKQRAGGKKKYRTCVALHLTVFTTVGWPEHAGLAFKGNAFGSAEAQQTLDVNFYGTKRATDALLPLVPDGGSIVNVCRRVPRWLAFGTWQAGKAQPRRDA